MDLKKFNEGKIFINDTSMILMIFMILKGSKGICAEKYKRNVYILFH